ncbi:MULTISPECIES: HugZ family protein [Nostoc]|uniref:Pyridoxamine 5'-phosphate oxidase family protein n=1 Tax=Nostoc paludosum FACHB-159 TaxID=2692908 RepID=A0ABR8KEG2_9NOSO|nr:MULTISPECIES: pyridoxamine 5'-phosphate oxidase family protein [Nostoc]MBD2679390.1 pyridoxamine 5'-phosphate oxidase family protein [Nostoc sp. FACHB-857]MBD2737253.1 pyridoxamine 5'-phosphate oxidase family protein [Nostoc paludosum FACHB-159]
MSQLESIQAEYEKFPEQFESIIISTVSPEGIPNASYAPFVMDDAKNIYIYVSGLATHTKNLHTNPHVSVLFIEDEAKSNQIFARTRLNFDCTVTLVERETDKWNQIVDKFQGQFGQIIEILRGLSDFRVFQLTPREGRFVVGFGAAYRISGDNLHQLVHITGDSNQKQE